MFFQHSNKEWQLFDSVAFKSEGQHASNMENTKNKKQNSSMDNAPNAK